MTPQNLGTAAETRPEPGRPAWPTGSDATSPHSVLTDAVDHIGIEDARAIVREHYGLDTAISRLSGERDDNFRVETGTEAGTWMLKVAHGKEAPTVTDFQSAILEHLAGSAVSVPTVVPTVAGRTHQWMADGPAAGRAIRMTTFAPGVVLRAFPDPSAIAVDLGHTIAELDCALADLVHPDADVELLWDIQQAHRTRELIDDRPDLAGADRLRDGFDRFITEYAPLLAELPRQVVHNDANPDNLLVDTVPDGAGVSAAIAVVDFGDAVIAPRVVDLAVAASYHVGVGVGSDSHILGAANEVIAGYHQRSPLTVTEVALLPELLTARVLTALTIASWRAVRFPENGEYILRNAESAWRRLDVLTGADAGVIHDEIRKRCAF